MTASDTRRDDPANSGSRCISDNGDFPLHLWTWGGRWVCTRCGAESTTRTRAEQPCASCANTYGHRYCFLVCAGLEGVK